MAKNNALPHPIEHALTQLGGAAAPEAHLTDVLAAFETIINAVHDSWCECDANAGAEIHILKEQIQTSAKKLAALPLWNVACLKQAEEEVSTVLNATETAANTIMEHAEIILSAESSDPAAYKSCVTDAVMQIFEACAFQDITGQRLSRVTETLNDMEKQVAGAMDAMGVDGSKSETSKTEKDQRKQDLHLHGPSNEGEGVSQEDIDALFD